LTGEDAIDFDTAVQRINNVDVNEELVTLRNRLQKNQHFIRLGQIATEFNPNPSWSEDEVSLDDFRNQFELFKNNKHKITEENMEILGIISRNINPVTTTDISVVEAVQKMVDVFGIVRGTNKYGDVNAGDVTIRMQGDNPTVLNERITRLTTQVQECNGKQQEIETLNATIAARDATIRSLQTQITQKENIIAEKEEAIQDLEANTDAETLLTDQRRANERLSIENGKLTGQINELSQRVNDLDEADGQLAQLNDMVARLEEKLELEKERFDELNAKYKDVDKQLHEAQLHESRAKSLEEEIQSMTQEHRKALNERDTYKKKAEDALRDYEDAHGLVLNQDAEIRKNVREITSLTQQIEEQEQRLEEYEGLRRENNKLKRLEEDYKTIQESENQLQMKYAAEVEKNAQLTGQIQAREDAVKEQYVAKTTVEGKDAQIKSLQEQIKELSDQLTKEKSTYFKDILGKIEQTQASLLDEKAKHGQEKGEHGATKKTLEAKMALIKEHEKTISEAALENQKLQQELNEAKIFKDKADLYEMNLDKITGFEDMQTKFLQMETELKKCKENASVIEEAKTQTDVLKMYRTDAAFRKSITNKLEIERREDEIRQVDTVDDDAEVFGDSDEVSETFSDTISRITNDVENVAILKDYIEGRLAVIELNKRDESKELDALISKRSEEYLLNQMVLSKHLFGNDKATPEQIYARIQKYRTDETTFETVSKYRKALDLFKKYMTEKPQDDTVESFDEMDEASIQATFDRIDADIQKGKLAEAKENEKKVEEEMLEKTNIPERTAERIQELLGMSALKGQMLHLSGGNKTIEDYSNEDFFADVNKALQSKKKMNELERDNKKLEELQQELDEAQVSVHEIKNMAEEIAELKVRIAELETKEETEKNMQKQLDAVVDAYKKSTAMESLSEFKITIAKHYGSQSMETSTLIQKMESDNLLEKIKDFESYKNGYEMKAQFDEFVAIFKQFHSQEKDLKRYDNNETLVQRILEDLKEARQLKLEHETQKTLVDQIKEEREDFKEQNNVIEKSLGLIKLAEWYRMEHPQDTQIKVQETPQDENLSDDNGSSDDDVYVDLSDADVADVIIHQITEQKKDLDKLRKSLTQLGNVENYKKMKQEYEMLFPNSIFEDDVKEYKKLKDENISLKRIKQAKTFVSGIEEASIKEFIEKSTLAGVANIRAALRRLVPQKNTR
jgi:hypothetical protein